MVPAGNKAKRLSSVNHTTKTIHHHSSIHECTLLILEWVNYSQLQSITNKALMIMPSLLLQKCSRNSKARDHTESLKRRLKLLKKGDFDDLVREVRFIKDVSFNLNKFTKIVQHQLS